MLGDHKIFVVETHYDSNDFEDYSYYLADAYYDLGSSGQLDDEALQEFLQKEERTVVGDPKYCSEYGIFNEYYDFDRGFGYVAK